MTVVALQQPQPDIAELNAALEAMDGWRHPQ